MKNNQQQAGNEVFNLDIPLREGTPGYLGMFYAVYLRMAGVLSDAAFNQTDLRPILMFQFLVSMIPGEEHRAAIRSVYERRIAEYTEAAQKETGTTGLSNEEAYRISLRAALETVGEVTDFTDEHIGISNENKLGFS